MPEPEIRSVHNPRVQAARRLRQRKHRQEAGLFLMDSPHLVAEGLAAGLRWGDVFYDPRRAEGAGWADLLPRLQAAGARLIRVAEHVLAALAEAESPQGLVAVAQVPPALAGPEALVALGTARVVACGGLQDPANVGAVLRSAWAFGVGAYVLPPGTADPFHPRALRASAGAALHLPRLEAELPAALQALGAAGYLRLGLDPHQGVPPEAVAGAPRVVLVVGAEGAGLAPAVRGHLDGLVRIPMRPGVESLNAAVAAGIALYVLSREAPAAAGAVAGAVL